MTLIAYKDGCLAADTAGWQHDLHVADFQKIRRIGDRLFAAAGRADLIEQCFLWMSNLDETERPESVSDDGDFCGVIVDAVGALVVSGRTYDIVKPYRDMVALGPHAEFLYGAMLAGASAEEAVRLAIKHCAFAGGDVQMERVNERS